MENATWDFSAGRAASFQRYSRMAKLVELIAELNRVALRSALLLCGTGHVLQSRCTSHSYDAGQLSSHQCAQKAS